MIHQFWRRFCLDANEVNWQARKRAEKKRDRSRVDPIQILCGSTVSYMSNTGSHTQLHSVVHTLPGTCQALSGSLTYTLWYMPYTQWYIYQGNIGLVIKSKVFVLAILIADICHFHFSKKLHFDFFCPQLPPNFLPSYIEQQRLTIPQWKWKWSKVTCVFNAISPSKQRKASKCTCFSIKERSLIIALSAPSQPSELII